MQLLLLQHLPSSHYSSSLSLPLSPFKSYSYPPSLAPYSYSPSLSLLPSFFRILLPTPQPPPFYFLPSKSFYIDIFFLYVKLFHKSCLSALFLLDSLLSHCEKICQQVSMQNQARTSIVSFVPSRVFSLRKSLFFIFI